MAVSGPNVGGAAGVTGSAKNSTTPGFLGGAGGGEKPVGLNDRNKSGAKTFGDSENSALNIGTGSGEDNLDAVRAEEETPAGFANSVKGREDSSDDEEEQNFFAKHRSATGTIIGLIVFIGVLIGGAQLSQPFSLIEQFRDAFDSMATAVTSRSNSFLKYQLNGKLIKNPLKNGKYGTEFSITNKQKQKLARQGIEIEEMDDNKTRVMKFTDSDGRIKYITADDSDIDSVKAKFVGAEVTSFRNAFDTDTNFFKAYKQGSLTWRGAFANMFEQTTTRFLTENKFTRNWFAEYQKRLADNGGDSKKTIRQMYTGGVDSIQDNGAKIKYNELDKDSDGKTTVKTGGDLSNDELAIGRTKFQMGMEEINTKLKGIAKRYSFDTGGGISGKAQLISNAACAFFGFLGGVSVLVAATETLQTMNIGMGVMEVVDKAKNGDDGGELNATMNELNTSTTERVNILNPVAGKVSTILTNVGDLILNAFSKVTDRSGKTIYKPKEGYDESSLNSQIKGITDHISEYLAVDTKDLTGSAMDSPFIQSHYNGKKVDPDDPSAKTFNFARNIKTIAGAFGVSMVSLMGCAAAKILANAAGIVETGFEFATCASGVLAAPATVGLSAIIGCLPAVLDLTISIGLAIGISMGIGAFIGFLTPILANLFTRNFADMTGILLGSALDNGVNHAYGLIHQANGGSIMNEEKYLAFAKEQQVVLAEDARYERATKDPFDASSQYTFLGSLLSNLAVFSGSRSIIKNISSFSNTIGSSIVAMTPAASAVSVANRIYENYEEICPDQASIGAVGQSTCILYRGTDMSTMNYNPVDDVIVPLAKQGNFEMNETGTDYKYTEDGNVIIDKSSDLAHYIKWCLDRSAPFGVVDQSVVADLTSTVNTDKAFVNISGNSIIGAVPMIGDAFDVAQNAIVLAKKAWVTGKACVAGNDETWDEVKNYQRFVEDQSFMESAGMIEKSAATAYVEEDRKEHPLDNSYEGVLARYSGMSKDDVIAMLDIMDYMTYLANYNPSERYAFGQEINPAGGEELKFNNDQKVAQYILLNTIEFADVRNRSFVV